MNRPRFDRLLVALFLTLLASIVNAADSPADRRQLLEEFNRAYATGEVVEAIKWGLKLEENRPNQPIQQYNLACVYAMAGNERTALGWLQRSATNGFRQLSTLESDTDLESLRQHPHWSVIFGLVQENAETYKAIIQQAFNRSPPDIYVPTQHDPKIPVPLIIALHGYGGRSDGYPTFWRATASKFGAILATPRGMQRVDRGYFWGDLGEAEAIVQLTIELVKRSHLIDEDRVVLTGFSQGGSMAMRLAVQHPKVFAGVIPMAGGYVADRDAPPPHHLDAPRYFFMVGSQDKGKKQSRQAAEDFESAGYTVGLRIYPGVGHTFPRFTDRELAKALKFVLD